MMYVGLLSHGYFISKLRVLRYRLLKGRDAVGSPGMLEVKAVCFPGWDSSGGFREKEKMKSQELRRQTEEQSGCVAAVSFSCDALRLVLVIDFQPFLSWFAGSSDQPAARCRQCWELHSKSHYSCEHSDACFHSSLGSGNSCSFSSASFFCSAFVLYWEWLLHRLCQIRWGFFFLKFHLKV